MRFCLILPLFLCLFSCGSGKDTRPSQKDGIDTGKEQQRLLDVTISSTNPQIRLEALSQITSQPHIYAVVLAAAKASDFDLASAAFKRLDERQKMKLFTGRAQTAHEAADAMASNQNLNRKPTIIEGLPIDPLADDCDTSNMVSIYIIDFMAPIALKDSIPRIRRHAIRHTNSQPLLAGLLHNDPNFAVCIDASRKLTEKPLISDTIDNLYSRRFHSSLGDSRDIIAILLKALPKDDKTPNKSPSSVDDGLDKDFSLSEEPRIKSHQISDLRSEYDDGPIYLPNQPDKPSVKTP